MMKTEEQRLAEFLHRQLCNFNHADQCSYHYEDWDKGHKQEKEKWLTKAINLRTIYDDTDIRAIILIATG